jgi:DNA-binding NarL/FixJ family response regulator
MNQSKINLTKRELEVLELCAKGYSNIEIAEELTISFHTAKAHVSSILEKLNAPSRLIAVLTATKKGLIK